VIDRTAGVVEVRFARLPLATDPDSHELSKEAPVMASGLVLEVDRVTFCAAVLCPAAALKVRLPGVATIVDPLLPPPEPTVKVMVTVVAVPRLGVMVRCPVYVPFERVAALAVTVRVTGLSELMELRLPLTTLPESQDTSKDPEVETGVVPLVDRVMFCAAVVCPALALKFKNVGFATMVPLPPPLPVPTVIVAVMVVAVPTLGVMVMCPV
jgi:hypothetical protein